VTLDPTIQIIPESCQNEEDGSIIIDTVVGGQPPYLFSLNSDPFVFNTQYQNLNPGVYNLIVQDADGCETFLELNVPAATSLMLDIGQDEEIYLGDSVQLSVFSNLIIDSIIWDYDESLNCLDCLDPIVSPIDETEYSVTLIDINGCEISDQIVIFVDKTQKVFIPNGFSPDGDGANDYFMIYAGSDVRSIRNFRIFDRWGANLFSRSNFNPNDPQYGWDGIYNGEVVVSGVYIYYAEIEFVDGRVEVMSGDITVIK
jgi:gliding motility-associated-like protein